MKLEHFKILHHKFTGESNRKIHWNDVEHNTYLNALNENKEFYEWTLREKFKDKDFITEIFCCLEMANKIDESLDRKGNTQFGNSDVVMHRREDGTFGIPIHDGGTSSISIAFCPWCGTNLTFGQ